MDFPVNKGGYDSPRGTKLHRAPSCFPLRPSVEEERGEECLTNVERRRVEPTTTRKYKKKTVDGNEEETYDEFSRELDDGKLSSNFFGGESPSQFFGSVCDRSYDDPAVHCGGLQTTTLLVRCTL